MVFEADDKETKRTARRMMRMVRDVNEEHLAGLGREPVLAVDCNTCHRGVSRPEPIDRIVERALEASGVPSAVARYRELRDEHYGSGAYDFGATPINRLGERLFGRGDVDAALALLEMNASYHDDSVWLHQLLGDAYLEKGEVDDARRSYERILSLDPDNAFARRRLEELASSPRVR